MPSPTGFQQLYTTIPEHWQEDGYVAVGADGYTVVASSLQVNSLIASFVRTGAGLWSCTLKQAWPVNLKFFNVVPVKSAASSFACLGDNVGDAGTTDNFVGGTPQVIHFEFLTSGSPADLAANSGFRYLLCLQRSTAYAVKAY